MNFDTGELIVKVTIGNFPGEKMVTESIRNIISAMKFLPAWIETLLSR